MRITELDKGEEVRIYLKSGAVIEGTTLGEPGEAETIDMIEIMTPEGITYIVPDQIAAYTLFRSMPG